MTQGEDAAEVVVGLGANRPWLGAPPEATVRAAARALARFGPLALSPLYDSPAWPDPSAPPYVNAVGLWRTRLSPEAALAALLANEAAFGRRRGAPNAPRTLDLDLLAHGDAVRSSAALTLPHPRIAARDFVLLPLRDVAPSWRHPRTGQGVDDLIAALGTVTAAPREPSGAPPCNRPAAP